MRRPAEIRSDRGEDTDDEKGIRFAYADLNVEPPLGPRGKRGKLGR